MGKNNEKTQVELNSYVGMQQIGRHFDLVTNSAEHMTMANQALVNGGENPLFSETLISNFANGTDLINTRIRIGMILFIGML